MQATLRYIGSSQGYSHTGKATAASDASSPQSLIGACLLVALHVAAHICSEQLCRRCRRVHHIHVLLHDEDSCLLLGKLPDDSHACLHAKAKHHLDRIISACRSMQEPMSWSSSLALRILAEALWSKCRSRQKRHKALQCQTQKPTWHHRIKLQPLRRTQLLTA